MPHPRTPGAMSKAEERFHNARFLAGLERVKAIPIEDVLGIFGDDARPVFGEINNYQWSKHIVERVLAPLGSLQDPTPPPELKSHVTELMKAPLPGGISHSLARLMLGNPASFSDPIEEIIDADPLVLDVMQRGVTGTPEKKLLALEAYRARRVVVAACVQLEVPHGSEGLVSQIQALSKPPVPEGG